MEEFYLSSSKQCVYVGNTKSSLLDGLLGVPLGSILGPILFTLHINDPLDVCRNVNIPMYVDDSVIYTHATNIQQISLALTSAMTHIQDQLTESRLYLNTQKIVCLMFSKQATKLTHSNVSLRGEELNFVNEFKYLGLTLDSTLFYLLFYIKYP